jgi:hypothetical protein
MREDPTNATPHGAKRKHQAHQPQEREKRHCIKAKESTWLDRDNGQHVIRVVREPEEQTQLICLAPRSACVYQAAFSLGTPDAVIIAAVEAALTPAPPQAASTGPRRPPVGGAHKTESGDRR